MIDKKNEADFTQFIRALSFAAEKHKNQKRKGKNAPPYINHSIRVARLLWEVGEVRDSDVLTAALLHDTIEDTKTSSSEVQQLFGKRIHQIVAEVTNEKHLSRAALKQSQIDKAPKLSKPAKQLKLADVICNIQDVIEYCPPMLWTKYRKLEYLDWAERVVRGLRGVNQPLERLFDEWLRKGKQRFR